jgi:hypothetical protein
VAGGEGHDPTGSGGECGREREAFEIAAIEISRTAEASSARHRDQSLETESVGALCNFDLVVPL